jgi:outer membrane protein assembly factor BamB
VDGTWLYALGSDGDLVCLEASSGRARWQKNVRKEFGGQPGQWAYSESPLVDDDLVVATPGGADATIVALNKNTGAVVWKSAVPGADPAAYASIVVANAGGRKQYVQFLAKGVVGVDAKTGEFLWRYADAAKGPAQIPTPIVSRDLVYTAVPRVGAAALRLTPTTKGITAEQVYLTRGLPSANGGAVLVGDHVYGSAGPGLVAGELSSGIVKWQAESIGPGSLAAADGHLYVHGENGDVALVEASPDAYREKGRFTPPNQPKHADPMEKAWSHPVVANGRLYIRDLGTLWAYDVKGAASAK